VGRSDDLLVLEYVAAEDRGRIRTDAKLGHQAAGGTTRIQRAEQPASGLPVRVDRAPVHEL